ncbi:CND1 [Hepatospora eriocheir]|uniref:CND1 n=1 Tax=Hepatospora eriocheir TaxID=1081669 RepID=A0A1X0QJY4_9MICR|nr:CND1 [Hepatospora eriocheir]
MNYFENINQNNHLTILKNILDEESTDIDTLLIQYFTKYDFIEINKSIQILGNKITNSLALIIIEKHYKDLSESIKEHIKNQTNINIKTLISLLESNDNASEIILFALNKDNSEQFIKESLLKLNSLSVKAQKTLSFILKELDSCYYVNYNNFISLLNHENHNLRVAFISIIEGLIVYFKEVNNLEEIANLTKILCERLRDVNYVVRNKVLGTLSFLFRNHFILLKERNMVIESILERIVDKTVVVRKKVLNLLSQLLLNHPFKNKGNNLSISNTHSNVEYEKEFKSFVQLMNTALEKCIFMLDCNLKTDILEICTFIKLSFLYNLDNSYNGMVKVLNLVFNSEYKEHIIKIFKDVIESKKNVIYQFVNNKAFEKLIKHLDVSYEPLLVNIKNNQLISESIYILRHLNKSISTKLTLYLIQYTTQLLFNSHSDNLIENLNSYKNTLYIVSNSPKIEYKHEIFGIITKNVIKMRFYEYNIISDTLKVFYSISKDPEKIL